MKSVVKSRSAYPRGFSLDRVSDVLPQSKERNVPISSAYQFACLGQCRSLLTDKTLEENVESWV